MSARLIFGVTRSPDITSEPPWWSESASCRSVDPELFFPISGHSKDAKKVCAGCPALAECLDFALEHDVDDNGIFGGLTGRERSQLKANQLREAS